LYFTFGLWIATEPRVNHTVQKKNKDTLTGVVQDLFQVETPAEHLDLHARFVNEPMSTHIIEALLKLNYGTNIRDRKRA
jgi:hypothetical protein